MSIGVIDPQGLIVIGYLLLLALKYFYPNL